MKPNTYFTSDLHLGHDTVRQDENGVRHHRGITSFERTQFANIQEHDEYIISLFEEWAKTWAAGSTLWCLGDYWNTKYLPDTFGLLRDNDIKVCFVKGNHDNLEACSKIEKYVDELYLTPVFITNKLILSHHPVAIWPGQLNVCGHIHNAILNDPGYIMANIHVNNYKPITMQQVNGRFAQLPQFCTKFLYEPWADLYKFIQDKPDCIYNQEGIIDLSASRAYQKMKQN